MNFSKILVESLLSWRDVSSILLNERNMFGVKYLKVRIMFCALKMLVRVACKFDIAHKLHELNCEQLTRSGIILTTGAIFIKLAVLIFLHSISGPPLFNH